MRAPLLTATLLLAASLAAPAGAQNQTGTIRVTVQTQATSEPLAGAQVTLSGLPTAAGGTPQQPGTIVVSPFGGVASPAGGAASTTTALTDAMGVALFDKVPYGQYSIRAQRDGYLGTRASPAAVLAPTAPAYALTSVLLNQASTSVTLTLVPAGAISGRVRDAYGAPLTGARVSIGTLGYRDGRPALLLGVSAQPDGQGNYRISPVSAGEYYVKVEPNALRGVGVFYPGVAEFDKAIRVPVQSDQEVVGVDFDMPNLPTFKVSGKMLNVPPRPAAANGLPVPNGILGFTFAPADPRNPDPGSAPLMMNAARGTDEFEISLPAGYWDIFPVIPMNVAGVAPNPTQGLPTYATGRARVLVTDRDIQNVTVNIGSSDVKVRVTGNLPSTPPPRISLIPRENMPSPLVMHVRSAQTLDANGEFTFKSVPPGKYSVQITPLPPTLHIADVRVGARSVFDDGIITVGLDPLEPVEVVVGQGGAVIQGTVTIPSSAPRTDAALTPVVLVPDAPRRGNPSLYKTTRVLLPTGRYIFMNVPAGNYKVFAFQDLPVGAEQDEEFIAKFESVGTPVKVVEGETATVDVRWIPTN